MIRHRRSAILENAIIEARKGGATIPAVAKLVKRSTRQVVRVLTIAGLTKKQEQPRLTLNAVGELRALRAEGVRIKELAARYGVSRVTVWKRLKGDRHEHDRHRHP